MKDEARARARLAVLLGASSLTVMAGALVAPALPGIARAFSHTEGVEVWIRLVLTLPALAIAATAPLAGLVLDRFGRRRVLLLGLLLYAFTGASAALCHTLAPMLASRLGLGVAVAMVMTSASTLMTDEFAGAARTRVMSLQGAAMGFGSFVFLLVGGALSDLHWRAPFLVYLVAVLLAVPAALFVGEAPAAAAPRPSAAPEVLPWRGLSPLFGAGLAGMLLFYFIPTQLPFLLTERLERNGLDIGLAVGGATVVSSLSSLLSPFVIARLGRPRTLGAAFAAISLGLALLSEAETYGQVLSATVVFGLGGGLVMPTLTAWVGDLAPLAFRGRAIGLLTTSLFLGQFLSPIAAGPILLRRGLQGSGGVFSTGAAVAAVVGVLSIAIARRLRAAETGTRSPSGGSG